MIEGEKRCHVDERVRKDLFKKVLLLETQITGGKHANISGKSSKGEGTARAKPFW